MPRNGSGTSTVINTFVIDTIADPDEVNANFDDVADQLTNSLPRDGQAGMDAPLPLQNGTAALPALTFTSDTDTGIFRKAANTVGITGNGVEIANFSTTGAAITGALSVSGALSFTSVSGEAYGDCRLTLSGGNLLLSRFNGKRLTINGIGEIIPSAGITLAPTGATPTSLYYIYAYMNSSTMTLERDTAAPVIDTTTGIMVKTGDPSRTLVGMARPIAGPLWADTATQRFVLSYYNRVKKHGENSFTADRTSTSTSFAEINSEIRVEFLSWSDTELAFYAWGMVTTALAAPTQATAIALDAGLFIVGRQAQATATGYGVPLGISAIYAPSVGYHYCTLAGKMSGSTGTWKGTGDGQCALQVGVDG